MYLSYILMNISSGTLFSLQTLQNALDLLGYPAVTLFIMIESIGIPMPGESMLLLASFYSAIDNHLQLPIVIACAAFGAIVGDNIGYYIGRTGGRAFAERFGKYIFLKPGHLDYAEQFFLKHGNKTVFLGRFIAILRIWAAFLAGLNRMHWRTFLIYNAAGGIVWATIVGTLGYLAGRALKNNFGQVEQIAGTVGWITGGIVLACIVIAIIVLRIHQNRHSRNIHVAKDNDIRNRCRRKRTSTMLLTASKYLAQRVTLALEYPTISMLDYSCRINAKFYANGVER